MLGVAAPNVQRMNMQYFFKIIASIGMALTLSSCASTTQYTETFSSLNMTADQQTFVVLGERYHYAFPVPAIMTASMQSDFRPRLAAAMPGKFHVSAGGKTFGLLRFQLTDDASAKEIAQAKALGYRVSPDGLIYYTTELRGQRYVAGGDTPAVPSLALRQTYRVEVVDSQAAQAAGQLMSPFIIAAGAGAAIAAPATLLIAVPVIGLKP